MVPEGFNEAAGIPRGRPTGFALNIFPKRMASMRPRVFPAEDPHEESKADRRNGGFNEAAGIPRGRHTAAFSASDGFLLQ